MSVVPDDQTVFVGQELRVTVDMEVSPGCQFPLLELELDQDGPDAPIFAHIDPPTSKVLPGISLPMTFRLAAVKTGEITFSGHAFGESKCGDGGWIWTWLNGQSGLVTVEEAPFNFYLPAVYLP